MSNQLACGHVMELQTTQHPAGFVDREGLVKRADRMGRHIAEHRPDALSPRIMDVREIAHTSGNVFRSAPFGDLHLVPGRFTSTKKNRFAVPFAPILEVVALELARLGRDRLADLTNELDRALVEADHRARFGSGNSA